MSYTRSHRLIQPLGNNAFAYEIRQDKTLYIPSLKSGTIDDVKTGKEIVFADAENGMLQECIGLKHFVSIDWEHESGNTKLVVIDNHNHALYFWIEALRKGYITPGCDLIHIDEHSDLWENTHDIDLEQAISSESYAWEFANYQCNVGNYIKPALRCGLIGTMIRIENEFQIDKHMDFIVRKNTILNLDLDIFAPELDYIDERKKVQLIQNLLKQVQCATIATSPYFIDQGVAIEKLWNILK